MKRVAVAVLVLAALVAAAFGVRAWRADDAASPAELVDTAPRVLVCAPEMAEACTTLADASFEVRVEEPGVTLRRLHETGSLDGDAWLTPRPWIELAREGAAADGRADPFGNVSDTLGRSDLVLIVRSDRRPTLETVCGGRIDWVCLLQRAGARWGDLGGSDAWGTVRVGLDDPAGATTGRLALAQMARTFAHRDAIDERDLEIARSAIAVVVPNLVVADAPGALTTMLEVGGSFDAVLALEAVSRVAIASPRASGQLEVVELGPVTSADAVLATAAGADPALDHDRVHRALTATGWHFPDKNPSGTPSATTLDALLALWRAAAVRN